MVLATKIGITWWIWILLIGKNVPLFDQFKISQVTPCVMISFPPFEQREGVPARVPGSVSEGVGRGNALVPEIGTETGGEAAHALLTGGVQGEKQIWNTRWHFTCISLPV